MHAVAIPVLRPSAGPGHGQERGWQRGGGILSGVYIKAEVFKEKGEIARVYIDSTRNLSRIRQVINL